MMACGRVNTWSKWIPTSRRSGLISRLDLGGIPEKRVDQLLDQFSCRICISAPEYHSAAMPVQGWNR